MEGKTTKMILKHIHDKLNIIQSKPLTHESMAEIIEVLDSLRDEMVRISNTVSSVEFFTSYQSRYFEAMDELKNLLDEFE